MKLHTGFKYVSMVAAVALLAACNDEASTDKTVAAPLDSGVLTANMDTGVKPGDDFFEYVNGTWLKNYVIPEDKASYGTFYKLYEQSQDAVKEIIDTSAAGPQEAGSNEQKVGGLYNSYMNMEQRNATGTAPLMAVFADVDALSDDKALVAYFATSIRAGFGAPFNFYIDGDAKDPTKYAMYTSQSGLGLPDREYYLKEDDESADIRSKYVAHIEKMLALAGVENAAENAAAIMALETKIATAHWKKEDNRDTVKTYNVRDRAGLKAMMPDFDWDGYFTTFGTADLESMVIAQPSYFEALNGIVTETPLDVWKTYFKWRALTSMATYLNEDLDKQNFDFYSKTLSGVPKQRPQWKRAVSTVNGHLGEVIGKVYVTKHFKPEAKGRMLELVGNLTQAYENSIKKLDWMGEETKLKALEKLNKFTPKIGYPDIWKDYSKLEIKGDDLFGNIIRSNSVVHDREIAKLGGPIQRHLWFMNPQTVNAYYNPSMNEIVFPAAILQPPFFGMSTDDAVNYGAIGGVIGHEIGHGFDDQGSTYDGDGALKDWWTEADKAEFKKRTSALVEQYNGFKVFDDLNVNGEFTLGENIGDLGGLSIAIKAYHLSLNGKPAPVIDGLTAEQRIFIGWAQAFMGKMREKTARQQIATDPHSPARFRVNGVVRNIPEFYDAFGVKPGDKLYLPPEDRVKIW
ncbi:M13 family metallopeptidase [Paremcibacter congregatus]|uniref:M13 family metallopeptidase n=1 Tax=Paremcibacter congregatus TaxID=2043170 RepID=UPI0030EF909A|tara:strand:- start:3832 stop:5886 length:2055 start_codon:yes stop_codon:yes gene_type:complete